MNVPEWMTISFPIIRVIFIIILAILAILMIVAVLFQKSGSEGGLGALGGQSQDTYYQKHKSKSLEGILKRATMILGIAIGVLSVLFFVTILIVPI